VPDFVIVLEGVLVCVPDRVIVCEEVPDVVIVLEGVIVEVGVLEGVMAPVFVLETVPVRVWDGVFDG
jgi:hypothetical protein